MMKNSPAISDATSPAADAMLREYQATLPAGIQIDHVMRQSEYVDERLQSLALNLLLGTLAVGIVIWVLMGWRSALIVTLTLPLASLMVLFGLQWLGIAIHQMSVTGLIIALGLLIDNAIVMVDEVRGRVSDADRSNLARIRGADLVLSTPTGADSSRPGRNLRGTPLSAFASVTLEPEAAALPRLNRLRMNEIPAQLDAGVLPSRVQSALEDRLAGFVDWLPVGYQLEYGGEASKRDDAVGNLFSTVGVLAVLMLATLMIRSWCSRAFAPTRSPPEAMSKQLWAK